MVRIATAVLAVAALFVAGCGGGSDQPVEGSTTPATVSTTGATTPAQTPAANADIPAQMVKLKPCLGGKPGTTYKWFQPTVDYAKSLGGDGFTVMLGGQPITMIAFPSPEAAQLGFKDISARLIALQQTRPDDYATVAPTASQVIANVLEVSTTGATTPKVTTKIGTCIGQSAG